MSKEKDQINIARIVYDAYPHSDLLPVDPRKDCNSLKALLAKVTNENIGDSLFKFIVTEIVEGGEGTLEGAIHTIGYAKEDVEAVLQALYTVKISKSSEAVISKPVKIMYLYEVQATEYNGEQEYSQNKLLAAKNIRHAHQIARDYFRQWYDDGDDPEDHNTDNPDEFEFNSGCIRLKIQSVQKISVDNWIKNQIKLHSISKLPNQLTQTRIACSASELLEACKGLASYTMELLYKLDDQVYLPDIEELQQARDAIKKHTGIVINQS